MKITRERKPRQTIYVSINGVKATTSDMKRFWANWKKGLVKFTIRVDADGDIIIETVDD